MMQFSDESDASFLTIFLTVLTLKLFYFFVCVCVCQIPCKAQSWQLLSSAGVSVIKLVLNKIQNGI